MAKQLKIYCNTCNGSTTHKVLHDEKRNWSSEEHGLWGQHIYSIVECSGCEGISFSDTSFFSEDFDDETGVPIERVTLYPNRTKEMLEIEKFYNVPNVVRNIYKETVEAYNNNLNQLCAAGLRAIIEAICSHEKITGGQVERNRKGIVEFQKKTTLEGKINGLNEKGIITKSQAIILHEHRFLGNDALHELGVPHKSLLLIAIEIIDNVLYSLYEINQKAGQLMINRQRREKNTHP